MSDELNSVEDIMAAVEKLKELEDQLELVRAIADSLKENNGEQVD